jgi:hypothetical protein
MVQYAIIDLDHSQGVTVPGKNRLNKEFCQMFYDSYEVRIDQKCHIVFQCRVDVEPANAVQ